MLKRIAIAAALVLSALALPAGGGTDGPARVIDGDTIDVAGCASGCGGSTPRSSKQMCERAGVTYACGHEATAHLRALVAGAEVACEPG